MKIKANGDQSVFVKAAAFGLIREAAVAAALVRRRMPFGPRSNVCGGRSRRI
jgi:hypothetical protein